MFRLSFVALMVIIHTSAIAFADPIEGEWNTKDATIAKISGCADRFCIVVKTGLNAGKEIGSFKPIGEGKYEGKITDPRDDRDYTGRAVLKGNELKLSGCALKIFCQTEVWTRILK